MSPPNINMGKGFNNYMCKKFFHPASRDNLKRVWMAEQKADAYKKKQEELRVQYEKEQDLYNNKALLSKESKDKLSVNFMYEPPPGAKKERQKEDDEPEYKFEWQRKYNAPREDYCKDNAEIRDQPFGIQVRNVRCIKCHKWGHINTDKECPLFNQSGISFAVGSKASGSSKDGNESGNPPPLDAMTLVQQMREDGLALKRSAMGLQQHVEFPQSHDLISSDDDDKVNDSDMKFLKSLSTAQKKKLLKKLEKLEKKSKKKDKRKSKKKKKHYSSDSDDAKEKVKKYKKRSDCSKKSKHNKEKKGKESRNKHSDTSSTSLSSSSSSDSEEDTKQHRTNGSNHGSHNSEKHKKKRDEENPSRKNEDDAKLARSSPTREFKIKTEKHHSANKVKESNHEERRHHKGEVSGRHKSDESFYFKGELHLSSRFTFNGKT
ncbi:hypothetical protein J437_LFUL004057 [Ladona fulva]|uniref:CBF1-interacting co-repressor CIR N-terminal domain-containing protein n=1 Tax=Ladona fulva TaxID=123851 RepID=A0A8K0JXG8_LADFU|nr:hypothetical protein J437_LFUL004057 [Ladona fulva]